MKKETNTKKEAPERLLIHEDQELSKNSKEILNQMFEQIRNLSKAFDIAGIPFNRDAFIQTMNEGHTWMSEVLWQKLKAKYKGEFTDTAIENFEGDKRAGFEKTVAPIEPIAESIKSLCNKITLDFNSVAFDGNEPVMDDTMTNFLEERTKYYAVGSEIPVYHALTKFIASVNEFEQFIVKTPYPLLMGVPGVYLNEFLKNYCFAHLPYFEIDVDSCDDKGYCILKINPEVFEEFRAEMKAFSERKNLEKEIRSIPPEVRFHENHGSDIPAASFKLGRDAGKIVDGTIKPETKKDRWKGFPGI